MSAFVIALLFSLGSGTWVYTKLRSRAGYGNDKTVLTGTVTFSLCAFIVVFTLSLMILH